MRRAPTAALAAVLVLAAAATADVELFTGETLDGVVTKSTTTRLIVRLAEGRTRSVHKRDVRSATDKHGAAVDCRIELTDVPLTEEQKHRLGQVTDGASARMDPFLCQLLDGPSRALVEELARLARDERSKHRDAAIVMMSSAGAPAAIAELVRLAVEDRNARVRFAAANELMTGNAIRCIASEGLLENVQAGLTDKKPKVRFCLAYVATKLGDPEAVPILEQNLKNADHHFRESAALVLAEAGSDAGLRILLAMVKRKGSDRERIAVCRALGALNAKGALSTLKTVARSKDEAVAAAARAAIEQIEAADEDAE